MCNKSNLLSALELYAKEMYNTSRAPSVRRDFLLCIVLRSFHILVLHYVVVLSALIKCFGTYPVYQLNYIHHWKLPRECFGYDFRMPKCIPDPFCLWLLYTSTYFRLVLASQAVARVYLMSANMDSDVRFMMSHTWRQVFGDSINLRIIV